MQSFKEFERDAWEKKASRYEDTWGIVSTQSIPTILNKAKITKGTRLLDCGCGLGHLCFQASNLGAQAIGCDYSHEMLRLASETYPTLAFEHQDAEHLSFSDESFDVVTLNFVLLHVSNQERTLLEAKRVLKIGGSLIFSMWLPPEESDGLCLMFSAVKAHADMSVIPPAQDIFLFANLERASEFLLQHGFGEIQAERVENFWNVSDGDAFFSAVQAGTRIGGTIDLQTSERKERIREEILTGIEEFRDGTRYLIPTPSVVVAARRLE